MSISKKEVEQIINNYVENGGKTPIKELIKKKDYSYYKFKQARKKHNVKPDLDLRKFNSYKRNVKAKKKKDDQEKNDQVDDKKLDDNILESTFLDLKEKLKNVTVDKNKKNNPGPEPKKDPDESQIDYKKIWDNNKKYIIGLLGLIGIGLSIRTIRKKINTGTEQGSNIKKETTKKSKNKITDQELDQLFVDSNY